MRVDTLVDLTGTRFGRLVAVTEEYRSGYRGYICVCDCGETKWVNISPLKSGRQKSCGCYRRINSKAIRTTHGMVGTLTYKAWGSMLQRCYNTHSTTFNRYGAMGITTSEEWRTFENFYSDMGDCPPGKTLDRVDNSKGYCKDNCRWATRKEQGNNRTNHVYITAFGETHNAQQWGEKVGITGNAIRSRLARGWSPERALTEPPIRR